MSNFEFLRKDYPALADFCGLAERYYQNDPNSCLMKLGTNNPAEESMESVLLASE